MSKKPLQILIDADMVCFRICSAIETPINWYDDMWTLHADASEAKAQVDDFVLKLVDIVLNRMKYEGDYEIVMCFTDKSDNFRKQIYPLYKANRIGKRKPSAYYGVMNWCMEHYKCVVKEHLEADDIIGILATRSPNNCVIISGDKDFKTIPSTFYNFISDELYMINKEQADYWHLYQTLTGDTADNYPGCKGIGAVSARKILDADPSWAAVVQAFVDKGLTEEDALVQARVARILRKEDYNFKTKKPIMWKPPHY